MYVLLGRTYPSLVIPTATMLVIARLCEFGFEYFGVNPFLTRAEVYKVPDAWVSSEAIYNQELVISFFSPRLG